MVAAPVWPADTPDHPLSKEALSLPVMESPGAPDAFYRNFRFPSVQVQKMEVEGEDMAIL